MASFKTISEGINFDDCESNELRAHGLPKMVVMLQDVEGNYYHVIDDKPKVIMHEHGGCTIEFRAIPINKQS